ncbi:MAG: 5-(carboxyamino)imidazole ribonucleotide synthase [Firmicutes bacterium]|jgi:5-(carboxyamino)imidazole ribonucleotide synthase|uniref:N5-carboxyaminoimidazole ribonucleotide synthase n=1 Tax=Sulfobacillus benefaciens TaxID=453960 RepID=A0A2T2X800_9FIRM|nr:5-(carboxyamino)imidazole ribonucleotide synthase [Bacillota bacterium]MCL5012500.1 5-(carboxyamino)imidazole ribonucleotide synthase [Bacillota bacterium]PSR30634.1 MAG: 5-(carboxyamino)imidazole ribonucleotide synthase [Sulfobacillus benefaciens]
MIRLDPGDYIGVIGGGQLGRMMAYSAYELGYRVAVLDPDSDSPLAQIAHRKITAPYGDREAVEELAALSSVITYEFENVSVPELESISRQRPVFPNPRLLSISQNRINEKNMCRRLGLKTANFLWAETYDQRPSLLEFGRFPAIVKTARGGYDGKGQSRVENRVELEEVLGRWPDMPLIIEEFVPYDVEISVVLTRDQQQDIVDFGVMENYHRQGILDVSISPARISEHIRERAISYARQIASDLDLVGTMTVEFFVVGNEVLVNELAPRPHNSGHLTIEAFDYSQFDQHIRAITGLPLGLSGQGRPAAMANLLGDLWLHESLNWKKAMDITHTYLHLYGKAEPRSGRKMGHITALAETPEAAARKVRQAREALTVNPPL